MVMDQHNNKIHWGLLYDPLVLKNAGLDPYIYYPITVITNVAVKCFSWFLLIYMIISFQAYKDTF